MCREALEAGFIPQETMYVYKKQLPTTFVHRLHRQDRVHRRRAGIVRVPVLLIWRGMFIGSILFETWRL